MLITDLDRLDRWARQVVMLFGGEVPYLVGSALDRLDYRDVDVRLILADEHYDDMVERLDFDRLAVAISTWGQHETRLPIDFQVQRQTDANTEHDGRRHALGIRYNL